MEQDEENREQKWKRLKLKEITLSQQCERKNCKGQLFDKDSGGTLFSYFRLLHRKI